MKYNNVSGCRKTVVKHGVFPREFLCLDMEEVAGSSPVVRTIFPQVESETYKPLSTNRHAALISILTNKQHLETISTRVKLACVGHLNLNALLGDQ